MPAVVEIVMDSMTRWSVCDALRKYVLFFGVSFLSTE